MTMKSISKDGSAFEGNQKLDIRQQMTGYRWNYVKHILTRTVVNWQ